MAKLLYIEASPRKERSASITVASEFLSAYREAHTLDTVEVVDLWHTALPRFDGGTIEAKYAVLNGQKHTPEQLKAWQAVERVARQFLSADKYLFSVPMWNFSIPYVLKHYLDVLVQPGLTFTYSAKTGYNGLVVDRPAVLVFARGGAYGAGSGAESADFQMAYLRHILAFIGLTDTRPIVIEPTMGGPQAREKAVAAALREAQRMARSF
jgi:FMN-dependent NADH-azoreductase